MSIVKCRHVRKSYANKNAVNDVSFTIEDKAFVVVAGPSGCGKSTLLKMIAGLIPSDEGEIILSENVCERGIAMVFQEAALFEHLSVYENIAFGLLDSVEEAEGKRRIYACAKMLKITDLLKHRAATLSGGEKQRVSIARALVKKPSLFLMDEPLSALDARLKNELRIELAQLYRQNDATFLYVTHDQTEAMTLADILIIMKDGSIQQFGHPKQLYQNPANIFTASFLGKYDINLFEGKIFNQHLYWEHQVWKLAKPVADQTIWLALRESNLYLDEQGCQATIELIEDIGDARYCHMRYKGKIILMKEDPKHPVSQYANIHFSFHIQDAFVFDVSEKRIYI